MKITKNMTPPKWLKNIKLLAWDLDGTLYPKSELMTAVIEKRRFKSVADQFGISLKEAEEKFNRVYPKFYSTTKTLDYFGIDGQQFSVDCWTELDLSLYIKPNLELVQAIRAIEAQTDLKQFILTNSNTQQTVAKKLNLIGLEPSEFDQIHTSIEIGKNKPDPEAFQVLWEASGFEQGQIVYVGDRDKTDIKPAKDLGLRAIQVNPDLNLDQPDSHADLVSHEPVSVAKLFLNHAKN